MSETEMTYWCEMCEVTVTFENASKHPDGLGGHVVSRWITVPEEVTPIQTDP